MKLDSTTSLPSVAKSLPAFREATKRSPDNTANATLPLILAVGAGFVSFCGTGLIAIGWGWPIKTPLTVAGVVMLVAMVGGFVWLVLDRLMWTTETIVGHDLNRDGIVGPPVQTYFSLHDGTSRILYGDVSLDPEILIEWCQTAVHGGSLSFEAWSSRFALPDGSKGRERYTSFREWLIKQGYAKKIGGPVGLCVNWRNPDAVAFVAGFAEVTPDQGTPLLDAIAGSPKKQAARRLAHTGTEDGDDDPPD